MSLRTCLKVVAPMFVLGIISTVLCGETLANCGCPCEPGSDGGNAVPEIGAGSAAGALSVVSGCAYLLKERFFGKRAASAE